MSWEQEIAFAPTGLAKACIVLDRAMQRGSKNLIAADIERAIEYSGANASLESLLELYEGVSYSPKGLRLCAKYFRDDLHNPEIAKDYFGIA